MSPDFVAVWVYLSASPLTALTITLVAYLLGDWIYQRSGKIPVLNPVLIAVILITIGLAVTDIDYWTYFEGAQFVHFLLGPATVALAIPVAKLLKSSVLSRLHETASGPNTHKDAIGTPEGSRTGIPA